MYNRIDVIAVSQAVQADAMSSLAGPRINDELRASLPCLDSAESTPLISDAAGIAEVAAECVDSVHAGRTICRKWT